MPKITILDEITINQIAAGEVIERPASAVKELIENALDAGAGHITVEIKNGGKELIHVQDDGCGMSLEDAKLAFRRHATSKISGIDDLQNLTSLGFRGEALSSIAAIARVTLTTKEKGSKKAAGIQLRVEGDGKPEIRDASSPEGCEIKIEDIFFNVPVRRKYLKSNRTELAHVSDIVTREALSHPDVGFRFIHNGKELLNTPPAKDPLANISAIYGRKLSKELLEVDFKGYDMKIEGYAAKPSISRSEPSHQSIFANGRYIQSPLLTRAVADAYKGLTMKRRHPVVILFIEVRPDMIDVNIHPSKLEIRFRQENVVYMAMLEALKKTLKSAVLVPKIEGKHAKMKSLGGVGKGAKRDRMKSRDKDTETAARISTPDAGLDLEGEGKAEASGQQKGLGVFSRKDEEETEDEEVPETDRSAKDTILSICPIGQILDTYIIAEEPSGKGLMLVDQHAASERIHFERLRELLEQKSIQSQEFITPILRDFSVKESNILEQYSELVKDLGFNIEHFGDRSYRITMVPLVLGRLQTESIYQVLDELMAHGETRHLKEVKEKMVHTIACHAAIRGGDKLTQKQMKMLLRELAGVKEPYTCPHGRPTIIELSQKELERMFKRTGAG